MIEYYYYYYGLSHRKRETIPSNMFQEGGRILLEVSVLPVHPFPLLSGYLFCLLLLLVGSQECCRR